MLFHLRAESVSLTVDDLTKWCQLPWATRSFEDSARAAAGRLIALLLSGDTPQQLSRTSFAREYAIFASDEVYADTGNGFLLVNVRGDQDTAIHDAKAVYKKQIRGQRLANSRILRALELSGGWHSIIAPQLSAIVERQGTAVVVFVGPLDPNARVVPMSDAPQEVKLDAEHLQKLGAPAFHRVLIDGDRIELLNADVESLKTGKRLEAVFSAVHQMSPAPANSAQITRLLAAHGFGHDILGRMYTTARVLRKTLGNHNLGQ
jgi:hypothetical protein